MTPPEADPTLLDGVALFAGLEPAARQAVIDHADWFSLPGGNVLFAQGEAGDALYIVLRGSLAVLRVAGDGVRRRIARIAAGEVVGEMALVSGRARSASVIAERDCEVLRLDHAGFEALVARHPQAMLGVTRQIVSRLEVMQDNPLGQPPPRPRSIALLPAGSGRDCAAMRRDLARCMRQFGTVAEIGEGEGGGRQTQWFHDIESRHDFILYQADETAGAWSRLCLRQADVCLVVVSADDAETRRRHPLEAAASQRGQAMELVMLHPADRISPDNSKAFLAGRRVALHHHVRVGVFADAARLARQVTGRAVGLVLSGGGARGFAHLGVLRAFADAGVAIDMVGGCSMGAIAAAGAAMHWDAHEAEPRFRRAFVDTNPVNDFTLPLVALTAGRRVTRRLRDAFGERRIEDLWLPYFCVSTNLTRGTLAVHRRGLLWQWLRASVAIPGIMPPWVNPKGEVFADGGVLDNLPVTPMRAFGRGPVIAVDVGEAPAFSAPGALPEETWFERLFLRRRPRMPSILQILLRAGTVKTPADRLGRSAADFFLKPPVESIDFLDWKAFDRAVELGRRHAQAELARAPASVFGR
ncbi:patatin-like phospholipase family protein [Zavarzinia compransoris]|uniref:Cyclic nucleotide-binding protein n=1 Tax=Zavarzinia compransoris TaxID=1264899 RepID=A0A317E051_9PROT|nr:patatin-like phospholipase family protein [Zavarzinia compransoris]PWR18733.1 cyclic nucleotide-binding protein [Zavarzinia compransoris]TDP48716.1 NTE family protein [Zavarzinia compransoris]